jgi:Cu+-exporting ATPase
MALVPIAGGAETDDTELRDLTRRLWIGVVLSIPFVILAMSPMVGLHDPFGRTPVTRTDSRRGSGTAPSRGSGSSWRNDAR